MNAPEAVAFYRIRADYYRRQAAQVDDPQRSKLVGLLGRIFAEKAERLEQSAA
ncbi:MAG TPA: hypothetical protein VGR70_05365 [Stellaceae bacterium]|nr:hypothetical protein [Stellaceae bacterium]